MIHIFVFYSFIPKFTEHIDGYLSNIGIYTKIMKSSTTKLKNKLLALKSYKIELLVDIIKKTFSLIIPRYIDFKLLY
jgi:hypothetical protein